MSTKLNLGLALMTLAFTTFQTPVTNESELVADHYNTTSAELADELEAARMAAEADMLND